MAKKPNDWWDGYSSTIVKVKAILFDVVKVVVLLSILITLLREPLTIQTITLLLPLF